MAHTQHHWLWSWRFTTAQAAARRGSRLFARKVQGIFRVYQAEAAQRGSTQ